MAHHPPIIRSPGPKLNPLRFPPKRIVALVALGVLCSAIVACGSSSSGRAAPGRTKVTVMLDWTPNTNHSGMYLAKEKGWYADAGLDVTFLQPGGNDDVNQIVANGTATFGISASEQLIPARQGGLPLVSIAAILQHNTSSLVALRSSGIRTPGDLAGRRYGAFGGGFEKALISKLVSCGGGNPSTVKYVDVGNADYRNGLTRHHYDFVWVFDGWDVIRMQDIDHMSLSRIPFSAHTSCIPDWYTPIMVTSANEIKAHPATVRAFMSATARGYRSAMAQPDEAAAALLAGAPELDHDLVERSSRYLASRFASDPAKWGIQDPAVWNRFVDFLTKAKIAKPGFDTAAAYTNSFLPKGS